VRFVNRISASSFFLFAALLLETGYLLRNPPFQSPDDFNHFYRVWQITDGTLLPVKADARVGGHIPSCVDEFMLPYRIMAFNGGRKSLPSDVAEGSRVYCPGVYSFRDFPNTANYSLVSYLPQSLAVFVLRATGLSMATIYYGGRIAAALFFIAGIFTAIRLIPFQKWLLAALMLLPMTLYVSNSYSADTMTNVIAALALAFILRLAFEKVAVDTKAIAVLTTLALLLALAKLVYVPVLLLMFGIPAQKFGSAFRKFACIAGVLTVAAAAAVCWSSVVMKSNTPYELYNPAFRDAATIEPNSNLHKQGEFLLSHGLYAFQVVLNTIMYKPWFYLSGYVGEFGVYLGLQLPDWVHYFTLLMVVMVLFASAESPLPIRMRLILFFASLLTYALIVLSQHLTWNKISNTVFTAMQGRYLVPVIPMLLLSLAPRRRWLPFAPMVIVFAVVIAANGAGLDVLQKRYFSNLPETLVDFGCRFENSADGLIATNNDTITLAHRGNIDRVGRKRSGCVKIAPGECGAQFTFRDLGDEDWVEIDIWKKGEGGRLVIAGEGDACDPYRINHEGVQFADEEGWQRMNMSFTMMKPCENSFAYFYLENNGRDTVRFDDLRFTVRRANSAAQH
jgi:hypothetical protein